MPEKFVVTKNDTVSTEDAIASLFTFGFMPPSTSRYNATIIDENGYERRGSGDTVEEAIEKAKRS
jgi:hypothetical protein